MQGKKAIAAAVMATSGVAMAQSSVTIFGVVDMAVTRVSASGAGNRTGVSSGGNSASRLGFRGTEDLGGGLAASFFMESLLAPDTGNAAGITFQRRSTVSLSGPFGELRLGRDYAPTFWNITLYDPFSFRGVGTSQAVNNFGADNVRNNNAVGYLLPATLGGFFGQVQYAFGEKQSTSANDKQGNYFGGRFGYASGPLNVAVAYGRFKQLIGASDVAPITIGRDEKVFNVVGTWDFGVVKPVLYYGQDRVQGGAASSNQLNTVLVGATAPLGVGELRASFARYDLKNSPNDFSKFAIGYGYNLSKRTQVYATVARLNNKGASVRSVSAEGLAGVAGVTPGGSSNGFDVGLRHAF